MDPGPAGMEGRYYCIREPRADQDTGFAEVVLGAPVPEDRQGDSCKVRPQFGLRHSMYIPSCALDSRRV